MWSNVLIVKQKIVSVHINLLHEARQLQLFLSCQLVYSSVVSCIYLKKYKITCALQNLEQLLAHHLNKHPDYTKIGKLGIFYLSRSLLSSFIYIKDLLHCSCNERAEWKFFYVYPRS